MKVKAADIVIPHNFVLVQPDAEFETFQHKGKTSFATGRVDLEHVASHYSIRGKVYAVPERLLFNLASMRKNMIVPPTGLSGEEIAFYFRSNLAEIHYQKRSSVLFDTDMDLNVGDIVFFNYQEHYNCYMEGRWVETEIGDMMLMCYDNLICSHADIKKAEPLMLNGHILVEPISIESVFGTNVYKKAGIYISNRKQDIEVVKRKINLGYVRYFGKPCKAYIDMPDNKDGDHMFQEGDIIAYNPKVTPSLEYGLHKSHFGGKDLVKMKRRDVFCIFPAEFKKDLTTLVKDFNSN